MGLTRLKKFNSWALTEEEKKDSKIIWKKFEQYGEATQNFWISRLSVRNYKQKVTNGEAEPVEEFMARCRPQAKLCDFKSDEMDDRLIEQLIAGTVHAKVQKELLAQDKKLTLDGAMQIAQKHEASLLHMKQLVETQSSNTSSAAVLVNAGKKNGVSQTCQKCGTSHSVKPKNACPSAWHKMQSMWTNEPLGKHIQGKFTGASSPAETTARSQHKTTIQITVQQHSGLGNSRGAIPYT